MVAGLRTRIRKLRDDPALAAIGWRTWAMTPMNFRWAGAWGSNATLSGSLRFERRVRVKLNWWNGSPIRAQYAALVDVGPLFLRTRAFLHVGGFNEGFSAPGSNGYYHDWEFSTRLWLSGWRAAFQETRMTGLTCVCFHCLASHACREKRCEKEVAKGTVRMGANYNDVSTSMSKRREASMHTLRRYYVNISRAVGRLNTRMAGRHEWLLALPGHCARQVGGRAGSQRVAGAAVERPRALPGRQRAVLQRVGQRQALMTRSNARRCICLMRHALSLLKGHDHATSSAARTRGRVQLYGLR